ncbi:MAG: hypothetical protein JST92_09050 [Deltaproteobacteria bacterium]|nr:hypothetical protein [Deltaproteobacteria bacterium]
MSPAQASGGGFFDGVAGILDKLRWAFVPLAMAALVAVGVHAAADVLDDQFLALADRADAIFDGFVSRWELTRPLVDLVDLEERTWFARALALSFELFADLVVALPMLGYDEKLDEWRRLKELLQRAGKRPTLLRVTRAPIALALCLAGVFGTRRLVSGQLFVSLRHLFGAGGASGIGRIAGILVFAVIATSIAWRVFIRALEYADARSEPRTPRTILAGLVPTLFLLPLAWAAIFRAAHWSALWR